MLNSSTISPTKGKSQQTNEADQDNRNPESGKKQD
jgi:hypothetical protein